MRDIDKFSGCLIGGAAGDALGYAIEFCGEDEIFAKYGSEGITEYKLTNGAAQISDDTQMTLFTANGLLLYDTQLKTRGRADSPESLIAACYKDWYITQTERYPSGNVRCSRLAKMQGFYKRRAPGTTCLSSLSGSRHGNVSEPINQSKGCGGVMRVAPVGLYFCGSSESYDYSDMLAAEAAAITHGHELGYIPAAALAHIVRAVAERDLSVRAAAEEAIGAMQRLFPTAKHIGYFTELMNGALELAASDEADLEALHKLGEGWIAEETLAIAVFCAVRYESDFEKALAVSVNHKGDSDSTGAVTGNILGAKLGLSAIPKRFLTDLELSDVILETADDLHSGCPTEGDAELEEWLKKYADIQSL